VFPKILGEISIPTKGKISIMQGFTSLMSIMFSGKCAFFLEQLGHLAIRQMCDNVPMYQY
jgi:hypothetical protein